MSKNSAHRWLILALLACAVALAFAVRRALLRRRLEQSVVCARSCLLGAAPAPLETASQHWRALVRSAPGADRNRLVASQWPASCAAALEMFDEAPLDGDTLEAQAAAHELRSRLARPGSALASITPALNQFATGSATFRELPANGACPRAPALRRYELQSLSSHAGAWVNIAHDAVALDQGSRFELFGSRWPRGFSVESGIHTGGALLGDRTLRAAPVAWSWFSFGDELANRIHFQSSSGALGWQSGLDLREPTAFTVTNDSVVVALEAGKLFKIEQGRTRTFNLQQPLPSTARFVRDHLLYDTSRQLEARRVDSVNLTLGPAVRLGPHGIVETSWTDDCIALALGAAESERIHVRALAHFDGNAWSSHGLDISAIATSLACEHSSARLVALDAHGALTRATCDRERCELRRVQVGELDASFAPLVSEVNGATWLVFRTTLGDVRLRTLRDGTSPEDRLLFEDARDTATTRSFRGALLPAENGATLLWQLENPSPLWAVTTLGASHVESIEPAESPLRATLRGTTVHLAWQGGQLLRRSASESYAPLAVSSGPAEFDDRTALRGQSYTYCLAAPQSALAGSPDCSAMTLLQVP